jgi:hypothetical protein
MSDIKMGEYQSRNGLNRECPTCHTIYNDRDGCQVCNPLFVNINRAETEKDCCFEMQDFLKRMNEIGSGGFEKGIIHVDKNEIWLDDGWNNYPTLYFRFCPFCGKNKK